MLPAYWGIMKLFFQNHLLTRKGGMMTSIVHCALESVQFSRNLGYEKECTVDLLGALIICRNGRCTARYIVDCCYFKQRQDKRKVFAKNSLQHIASRWETKLLVPTCLGVGRIGRPSVNVLPGMQESWSCFWIRVGTLQDRRNLQLHWVEFLL